MENFNKVYRENHKLILNIISMKVKDHSIAEELTNDVFMRVYKHLETYDAEKATMRTWISNIAKNIIIDHYRKSNLEMISLDSSMSNDEDSKMTIVDRMASNNPNPYKEMSSGETVTMIQNEIDSLNKKYRNVAHLYFNEGLSYEEISTRLNLQLGTVKVQINRARRKLVSRLKTVRV